MQDHPVMRMELEISGDVVLDRALNSNHVFSRGHT
jgi:hypothetical protein